jgi:hypothetical protein
LPFLGVFGNLQLQAGEVGLNPSEDCCGKSRSERGDDYDIGEVVKPIAMLLWGGGLAITGFWQLFRPSWNPNRSFLLGVSALLGATTLIVPGGIWLLVILWIRPLLS